MKNGLRIGGVSLCVSAFGVAMSGYAIGHSVGMARMDDLAKSSEDLLAANKRLMAVARQQDEALKNSTVAMSRASTAMKACRAVLDSRAR